MNFIEKLYYKIFKSEEEYQKQVKYETRRAYIIGYIKNNISYVRHYNSYRDEEDDASKYGLIFIHKRCNIKQLYKEGYYDGEIHFAALYLYDISKTIVEVNTANLNVYVYQRHAQYYGEYTWEDNNESNKKKHYSQYQDKTSNKFKEENNFINNLRRNRSIE